MKTTVVFGAIGIDELGPLLSYMRPIPLENNAYPYPCSGFIL